MDLHRRDDLWYVPLVLVVFVFLSLMPNSITRDIPGFWVVKAGIVFLTLTFLPGYVFMRFLGIRTNSYSKRFLYSVGGSMPYVLAVTLLVNFSATAIGIGSPLSPLLLATAIALAILAPLTIIDFDRPRTSMVPYQRISFEFPHALLFLSLIPLLAALGAYILNIHGSNIVAFVTLVIVAAVPVMLATRTIPRELTPIAIVAASMAVLFHTNLVSTHIWGWDIHYQYYVANTAYEARYWNPYLESSYTTLPVTTLLAAVYSLLTGIDIVWVYKVFYPLLAALIPLGIYAWVREFSDDSVAILAPFVYAFFYAFFKDMPDKQFMGELYLAILLLLFLDRSVRGSRKWFLGFVLAVGMILSHYAVSFFFIVFAVSALVGLSVLRYLTTVRSSPYRAAASAFLIAVGCFWVVWFTVVGDGIVMEAILSVVNDTVSDTGEVFAERSGADYATRSFDTPLWIAYFVLHIGLVGSIGLGLAWKVYAVRSESPPNAYLVLFSGAAFVFVGLSVVFPFSMGFDRMFKLGLVVLAPFAVTGWMAATRVLSGLAGVLPLSAPSLDIETVFRGFSVFLLVLFLLSSGAAFTATDEQIPPYSIGLDPDAGWPVYERSEVETTHWLAEYDRSAETTVAVYNNWEAVKSRDGLLISEITLQQNIVSIHPTQATADRAPYIYVSEKPVEREGSTEYIDPTETPVYRNTIVRSNKISDGGEATIYHPDNGDDGSSDVDRSDRRVVSIPDRGAEAQP